ncbi:MAG: hypothetical protein ABI551_25680, partial [Polyangiaceae bacterium]
MSGGDNYDDDEVTPTTGPPTFRETLPFGPKAAASTSTLNVDTQPFAFAPSFHPVEDTGSFKPGDFEAEYETLYSEALAEGDISDEERQRLDIAASALGMPAERLKRLEEALRKAYDRRASITLAEDDDAVTPHPGTLADRAPPSMRPGEIAGLKTIPPASGSSPQTIPPSRASVLPAPTLPPKRDSIHGAMRAPMPAISPEDDGSPTRPNALPALELPTDKALDRYLRQPRTEADELHDRFLEMGHRGALDEQLGVATVLARRSLATTAEREVAKAHKMSALQRPAQPLTTDAWKLLYHPDQDRTTGEIFAVIASAVLLARVTAMRKQKILPKLDPSKKHDPMTSTVSVVRALGWSAATLGMTAPPIFVAPESKGGLEIVPQV